MTLAPGAVFAGFTIERTLGVGGMGTVYLARHPRLPRAEALKLLRPELSYDPDFAVRFAREADVVARLDHPNIVGVNDRGAEEGQLWISMPFIDGMDAEAALAQGRGPLQAPRAIHIVSQIAAALDYAHSNGLWHRDVKPANILLAPGRGDEPERVWLTDFGIAKAADDALGLTKTGNVIATFDYAPPEQFEGRAVDHRVDIYALGCVLYKLLTGSVPYPGTTMAAALHGHLNLPPPRPTERTPWLAPGLDEVIAKAMAKDPDQRYANCRALASEAQSALGALPDPPPLPYSVSALRNDRGSGEQMILGPVDTEELSPVDRDGLLGLVRRSRLFDLPASLPIPKAAYEDETPPVPAYEASCASEAITIVVRATGRTAVVSYSAAAPRPAELDHLLRDLEDRRTWQPAGTASPERVERAAAHATVLERRPGNFPPYVPPTSAPRPASSEPPPHVGPSTREPSRGGRSAPAPPTNALQRNPVTEQREAARRQLQPQLERRAEAARKRRRNLLISVAAAFTVFIVVGWTLWFTGVFDEPAADPAADTETQAAECTYSPTDPAANPNLVEVGTPPEPEDTTTPVVLAVESTQGAFQMTLDPVNAPCATNSMKYLATAGFFNGSPCHRLVNSETFGVLQCGDPSGTGAGGPAYSYTSEPASVAGLAPAPGTSAIYPKGSVAMAQGGQPPTIGSQFFICFQDTQLPPEYTLVGTVTAGLEVIEAVAAAGNDGSFNSNPDGSLGPGGGAPNLPITIQSMSVRPVDNQITDLAGVLDGDVGQVREALDRLREHNGTQLFVVFVTSFDGMDGLTWAEQFAEQSQLGSRDVLFAVAVADRAYGLSVDADYPLSDDALAELTATEVEPLLSDEDWAGAAVALADGLRSAP